MVGAIVGDFDGALVVDLVGAFVGLLIGVDVGVLVGVRDGIVIFETVGAAVILLLVGTLVEFGAIDGVIDGDVAFSDDSM